MVVVALGLAACTATAEGTATPGGPPDLEAALSVPVPGLHPVDPVQPRAPAVRGDEVPDARLDHEAVGVEQVAGGPAVAVPVTHPQPAVGPHGLLDGGQLRGRRRPAVPAGVVDEDALPGLLGGGSVRRGHGRDELVDGGGQRGPHAEVVGHRSAGERDQGPGLLGCEPRHVGPVARHQGDAAAAALLGPHRDAGGRQRLDVPVDRADAHFELGGHGRGRDATARLQDQQQ